MAYVNQELKARISLKVKALLKHYGIKGTLSVRHHSTLVLKIKSGTIDFFGDFIPNDYVSSEQMRNRGYCDVNHYHLAASFSGKSLEVLEKIKKAMHEFNYDNSDPQTDYFDVGYYVSLNIGEWNRPYKFEG